MEKPILYGATPMKLSDLEKGHVYLMVEGTDIGRVMLYLGKDTCLKHVFYVCGTALLDYLYVDDNSTAPTFSVENTRVAFRNADYQLPGLQTVVKNMLRSPGDTRSILSFTRTTKAIIGEFPCEPKIDWEEWYEESFKNKKVPVLLSDSNACNFVKTKDLIPGNLYYRISYGNPNIFAYLGRAMDGSFIWFRIYETNDLKYYPEATKRRKQAMPIRMILEDQQNRQKRCVKDIMESYGDVIDVSKITQSILNEPASGTPSYMWHKLRISNGVLEPCVPEVDMWRMHRPNLR